MNTLGERGERFQSFKTDVDLQSPHLGAFNPSLTQDFVGWIRKSPKGEMEREGGDGRGRGCGQTVKEVSG
jgi:hypothetical protein